MTPSTFTLNGWRLASALLLMTKAAQAIQLTAYNTPQCEGSVVISLSLVNANQCNNIDGGPMVYSADASSLQGCIVTLYSNVDCIADQGEIFLDIDDECDTVASGFNVASYEVDC
jgi:hypothetical protein